VQLTLIRHAKSSWAEAGLSDFERPLNARGQRDAPLMAERLRAAGIQPQRLVSSPALRALSTARLFRPILGVAEPIVMEPRIYEASLATLLGVVSELDPSERSIVLFGHNPGLSELAECLSGQTLGALPTCAAVTLTFSGDGWGAARRGLARLEALRFPKDGESTISA
jgi:phosphohistidine phosphatase